jgi:hypothetical protein
MTHFVKMLICDDICLCNAKRRGYQTVLIYHPWRGCEVGGPHNNRNILIVIFEKQIVIWQGKILHCCGDVPAMSELVLWFYYALGGFISGGSEGKTEQGMKVMKHGHIMSRFAHFCRNAVTCFDRIFSEQSVSSVLCVSSKLFRDCPE